MTQAVDNLKHPTPAVGKPNLLDQVRTAIRRLHYNRRTEKIYVHRIKRFILFHGKRHPLEMGGKMFLLSGKIIKTSS